MGKEVYQYARCRRSKNPVIQLLGPEHVIFTRCASCGAVFTLNHMEGFDEHFEFFEVRDRWYKGMLDDHIRRIRLEPSKFRVPPERVKGWK